ncbi:MAG: hypothetical protein K2W95_19105 [Candidatus Obscuribacterales bacterium]|nr:hypothetical protein [Candidatus Obscuribacterales bacterium]
MEHLPPRLAPMTLFAYFGEVLLLDVSEQAGSEISYAHLAKAMEPFQDFPGTMPIRFLIRAGSKEEKSLTSDALLFLHSLGTVLVGLDTDRLDRPGANFVEEFLRENTIVWLLNLDLKAVDIRARYTLTAFPVLPDAPGDCPARAILLEDTGAQE